MKISCSMLAGASLLALGCASALAQQVTGVPGSPGATTTLDGKQLPPADPKFGGVIREKASESQAWWAPRVVPPKGALLMYVKVPRAHPSDSKISSRVPVGRTS
jgi:hypothetical protein